MFQSSSKFHVSGRSQIEADDCVIGCIYEISTWLQRYGNLPVLANQDAAAHQWRLSVRAHCPTHGCSSTVSQNYDPHLIGFNPTYALVTFKRVRKLVVDELITICHVIEHEEHGVVPHFQRSFVQWN